MLTQEDLTPEEQEIFEVFTPKIRDFKATDQHFVLKTWLRNYGAERYHVSKTRFYGKQQELIRKLCTKPNSRIAVVCDSAHEDYVVAFAVADEIPEKARHPMVLHFAYVRRAYREQGIFKMMLKALGWYEGRTLLVTQWTRGMYQIRKKFKIEHDEWILMGIVNEEEL